jgi:hypothetical protein
MRLERGLKGRDEELKLVEGQAGKIEELCGAILHVSEPYMRHWWCLLLWEAQYTINRDNLNYICQIHPPHLGGNILVLSK